MDVVHQAVFETAQAIAASTWWRTPNSPTPGRITSYAERLNNPEQVREFRGTEVGAFYLSILDAYESAFEDDWLPSEILGFPLPKAEQLIALICNEIQSRGIELAERRIREHIKHLS